MGWAIENISPLYRTDAKPRAEAACRLCRGAKEEEQRSKGAWGIGNTLSLPERLICASLDEPLPPETAQDCTKTPDALHRALFLLYVAIQTSLKPHIIKKTLNRSSVFSFVL